MHISYKARWVIALILSLVVVGLIGLIIAGGCGTSAGIRSVLELLFWLAIIIVLFFLSKYAAKRSKLVAALLYIPAAAAVVFALVIIFPLLPFALGFCGLGK